MNTAQNKLAGWFLLAVGLIIIFWSIFSSYNIFTGKNIAPEIFAVPVISQDSEKTGDIYTKIDGANPAKLQSLSPDDLQKMQSEQQAQIQSALQDSISKQFEKIIPADLIPKLMNLSSWSIFIFILIYAGSQISGLGIKLLGD